MQYGRVACSRRPPYGYRYLEAPLHAVGRGGGGLWRRAARERADAGARSGAAGGGRRARAAADAQRERAALRASARAARDAARCAARIHRPHRDEERLRSRPMRGMHRAGERPAHQFLPLARGGARQRRDRHHRRTCAHRQTACHAGGVRRAGRLPVRLLHAGPDLLRRRVARRGRRRCSQRGERRCAQLGAGCAERCRGARAHERQHLPLRRLPEHRHRGEEGRRRRMNSFSYVSVSDVESALREGGAAGSRFLGAGTNLLDLMKGGIERPRRLVDVTRLPLAAIEEMPDRGLRLGAMATNSDAANHPLVRTRYPLLSQALLAGASPQLRNMATVGGNLLQRTRCYYFYDPAFPQCNKRNTGSGCGALNGYNRIHAILEQSEQCIATNPSDMNVALAALEAAVRVQGPNGEREIPSAGFHRLPGSTPNIDTNLDADELITAVDLPALPFATRSHYLKVRDRASYAFALVSVGAALEIDGGKKITAARIALGGVAHKPWRAQKAEEQLVGKNADEKTFRAAADAELAAAKGYEHNSFKIELAKRSIVRALSTAAGMTV